ncbi:MAG: ParB/RepB/Spo0J family partition protein [Limimaricola sp.]|uniref:ParB/RepB/Spo0J family partition protein n=1 Tax=Limimaricola sp. TaxID=2211665 RepID=UPI001D47304E|nr:ParB/RepB/Spo0J family partition protein [Limimaricola sp.]MBI1417215.1 ParB/RepB/Spo0J family partition protein [Limimaricola sp.]
MAEKPVRNRGLGRGLSALMADVNPTQRDGEGARTVRPDIQVPIDRIQPNPDQPRRSFDPTALEDLSASIREKGIIQPLIVRPNPDQPGTYQLVAGERRWRAAQNAKLHSVPVLVRDLTDSEMLEIAIIENVQRADLNAIDEAAGYRQLMDRFGHTQDALSQALGKSRSHIANLLRLLTLPPSVQAYVTAGKLDAGHARTLVGREDAETLARKIIAGGLSVRAAEALTRKTPSDGSVKARSRPGPTRDADTVAIEQELSAQLKMPVRIDHPSGQESGKLMISYSNLSQLDDLLRLLAGG